MPRPQTTNGGPGAMWKGLARRAFLDRKYPDALQLYLEALKLTPHPTHKQQQQPCLAQPLLMLEEHAGERPNSSRGNAPQPASQQQQQQQQTPCDTASDAPEWCVLASNIAAVLLKLDRPEEALAYATAAAQAAPCWLKALYRQACALSALDQHSQAAGLMQQLAGLMEPGTPEAASVASKLLRAQAAAADQQQHQQVQAELMAAHMAWATTTAREASGRESLLQQLQQGMSGYTWEPQDWDWRPTWTASMRHQQHQQQHGPGSSSSSSSSGDVGSSKTDAASQDSSSSTTSTSAPAGLHNMQQVQQIQLAAQYEQQPGQATNLLDVLAASADTQQQQYMQLLGSLTHRLAELEGPKRGLQLLHDQHLLSWYRTSIEAAVADKGPGAVVLVVANGGGGLLGLMAAAAGAASVYVVEKGRWGYRAAQQLLQGNRDRQPELVSRVELVPVPLERCVFKLKQMGTETASAAGAGAAAATSKAAGGGDNDVGSEGLGQCTPAAAEGADGDVAYDIDAQVHVCRAGKQQHQEDEQQAGDCAFLYDLSQQADVLVTDLLDYSVLGQGLLSSLQAAAAGGLLAPGVLLLPSQVQVQGQLVNTALTAPVSGFDLGAVNKYKWHPTIERIDHDRLCQFPAASAPVDLQLLDLQQWVQHSQAGCSPLGPSSTSSSVVPLLSGSTGCDALAVWFELSSQSGAVITTGPPSRSSGCSHCFGIGLYYLDSPLLPDSVAGHAGQLQQHGHRQLTVFTSAQQQLRLCFHISSATGSTSTGDAAGLVHNSHAGSASSAAPAGCYSWSPHGIPRHAMLPRWHFDMLADDARNTAYDAAIRRALTQLLQQRQEAAAHTPGLPGASHAAQPQPPSGAGVHVLDIGTGTGLLSMMAARAGADKVTAVESVRHLTDTSTGVVAINGYSNKINVVHKDGRYMTAGSSRDMAQPADLLAFEVFDCGMIGEGALHIVAAARAHLLQPGARILPAAAKVYCQPIQYNRQAPAAVADILDPSPLYCYSWQPDYFEVDLAANCHTAAAGAHEVAATGAAAQDAAPGTTAAVPVASHSSPNWMALAAPQLVFEFDFNTPDPMTAFQPAEQQLAFQVVQAGVCNAIAFWFELQLDEHTRLSSSPYTLQPGQPSTTWKQAVQLLPEHTVYPRQQLGIMASHDTYAINFSITQPAASTTAEAPGDSSTIPAAAADSNTTDKPTAAAAAAATAAAMAPAAGASPSLPQRTGVPFVDPVWKAAYDATSAVQSALAKALTQDPLEYRRLANAALLLAMRPWGLLAEGAAAPEAASAAGSDGGGRAGTSQGGVLGEGGGMVGVLAAATALAADPHHAAALLVRLMM